METCFIRHTVKMLIENSLRRRLWKEGRVAIHYPEDAEGRLVDTDNSSLETADYTGRYRRVVECFLGMGEEGGYVCARYHDFPGCVIGVVEPSTRVELIRGRWSDRDREVVIKSLKIKNPRYLSGAEANRLMIGCPHRGTFAKWHLCGNRVERYVRDGRIVVTHLDDLLPLEQEIMCSEFLRMDDTSLPRLVHLTSPVGRTRETVDVAGIDKDDRLILAQVTHHDLNSKEASEKIRSLRQCGADTEAHLLFFCRCSEPSNQDGVTIYPLEEVFDRMSKLPSGRSMLRLD